jgi:hypothetical protein
LSIRALRGGAALGREIAALVFSNRSARTCAISGYPAALLRLSGAPLGAPATHDPGSLKPINLRPGGSVQAQLTAITTCQAPVSDTLRITPPRTSRHVDRALRLRACTLSVGPVEPAG